MYLVTISIFNHRIKRSKSSIKPSFKGPSIEECIKKAQDCGSDLFCIAQVGLECEGVSPPVLRSNNGKIEIGETKIFLRNSFLIFYVEKI